MTDNFGNQQLTSYYDDYTKQMLLGARKTFSRYHLGICVCLIISYVVALAVQVVLMIALGPDGFNNVFENIYVNWLLGVGPMYLLGIPALYLIVMGMPRTKREKSKLSLKQFLGYFVVSQGFMILGSIIGNTISAIMEAIVGRPVTNTTSELIENSPIWLIILVVVFIGPILEELVFRKLMIDRLSRYGDAIAIIVSAVAFGLFHGNFFQFFYAAMLGAVLGYMYTKTGNAIYNTLLHMIINFFGSIVSLFILDFVTEIEELSIALEAGEMIDFARLYQLSLAVGSYSIVQYVVAIGGIILFVALLKNRMIKVNPICEYTIPKEKRVGTVLLNVGTILFLILSVGIFVMDILLV